MDEHYYQIILLGNIDKRIEKIRSSLASRLIELKIDNNFIKYFNSQNFDSRSLKHPTIAIYFGGDTSNILCLKELLDESVVIIPIVKK
ncbi:hypothetical protein DKP84_12325 [Acinetobacter pittii]|nr:hypothetical protein DKP84_12325 [Acinetobacter pittii]